MATQTARATVIVASERADVRDYISGITERQDETSIVGEAPDATTALWLARDLRPDVVIVDTSLPRVAGLSDAPLTRIGGLDAAETLAAELPETSVVLVGNLDEAESSRDRLRTSTPGILTSGSNGGTEALALHNLVHRAPGRKDIVFASVSLKPWEVAEEPHGARTDKMVVFGSMVMALGWICVLTIVLAPVGFFIAATGALAVAAGLTTKWLGAWRRRWRRGAVAGA
jgi:DNA-binding NarL/FixJ family response regulator